MEFTHICRKRLVTLLVVVVVVALNTLANPVSATMVDMTHILNKHSAHLQMFRDFKLESIFKQNVEAFGGMWIEANNIMLNEHTGTHMDAPTHTWKTGIKMHQITLEDMVGPAAVLSVVEQAKKDPGYKLQVKDLEEFEMKHGRIPDGAIVLLDTDGAKHYNNASAYYGTATPEKPDNMIFPGFGGPSVTWLVDQRKIRGIGTDRLSFDAGLHTEAHIALLSRGKYGMENLNNINKLPPLGATLVIGGLPIEGGSASPARVAAFWGTDLSMLASGSGAKSGVISIVFTLIMILPFLKVLYS